MPVIAVTSDIKFHDIYEWHSAPRTFVNAVVKGANAVPVIVPSLTSEADIDEILDRVDGVLLTGARSNVYPGHYGDDPSEAHEPHDHERDATTLPLARKAIERGIPLLAICRGIQELNVALGGTLATEIQQQEGRQDHRATESKDNDVRFQITHPVHVKEGSCLAEILGTGPVAVNSLHRQAIRIPAANLQVEATADDGTIEAVSVIGAKNFALGVQWHPEYWVESDAPSAKIFAAFGDAARKFEAGRNLMSEAAE